VFFEIRTRTLDVTLGFGGLSFRIIAGGTDLSELALLRTELLARGARLDSDRAEGAEPYAAVVNAALSRFRPILMTTVTTVFGLLPLIISLDPLFFSMAVILAFGLIFGTILTLGVVPALYAVLFRVKAG